MKKRLFYLLISAFLFFITACDKNSKSEQEQESDHSFSDAELSDSDLLFDTAKILEVNIEMTAEDWEFVRNDTRDLSGMSGENCFSEPFFSTYTYKSAEVIVEGVKFENVGVRKKGFVGSVSSVKPGLKVKFDKFVEGKELFGKERLTLNNNSSDPSYMKQCVAYDIFRKAGLAAPRCNFAKVTVNGEYMGLYTNVEAVKKRFLKRHFSDNDGNLYEGVECDFREGWTGTFEPKTSSTDTEKKDIDELTEILKLPDEELIDSLSNLVDLEAFYKFWALETILGHRDGYTNDGTNFFIYNNPENGKFYFIPWGVDKVFFASGKKDASVHATTILPRRLYNMAEGQTKYLEAMSSILSTVWNENSLKSEIDRIEELIGGVAADEPDHSVNGGKSGIVIKDFSEALSEVRAFVEKRRQQIQEIIDNPPVWEEPLKERKCEKDGDGKDGDKSCVDGETFEIGDESWECVDGEWVER